jgi:predicted RNA-binding protein YlqC (UPF0109 family)
MSKRRKVSRETIESLRSMLVGIVQGVVDHPEDVEVNIVPASYRLLAELHTNVRDVGQVIGKSGHVVDSIRSIMSAYGGKHGVKVDLDFVTEQEKMNKRKAVANGP